MTTGASNVTAARHRAGRAGRGRSRGPAQRAPRRRARAGDAVARGLAGGAGRDGRLPPGLRPPPRAPRLRPADHRARASPGGGEHAGAGGGGSLPARCERQRVAGIGYAALALRAAPAGADTSEVLAAIGTMADRLARRASAVRADARNATLTAHIEVVESYGVKFKSVDVVAVGQAARAPRGRGSATTARRGRACWPTPAAAPVERARAALFLAGRSCQDRTTLALAPTEARAWNDRRLQALQSIEYPVESALPPALLGRRAPAPRGGVRVAGVRRGPPRKPRSGRARRRGRRPRAGAHRSGRAGARGRRRLRRRRDPRRGSRWATEPAPKPAGKRAVDVVVRAARRGRDLRPRRPGRGRRQDARRRRAVHLRCRLAERAALGALRQRRRPSPCSRWRPGPSCGSCAAVATAAGRSKR